MWDYYRGAVVRSFKASVAWAIGQGWLLTVVLAVGLVCASAFLAAYRVRRGKYSLGDAVNAVVKALQDFALSLVFGSACALIFLFAIFFIQDAPDQLTKANRRATEAETRLAAINKDADLEIGASQFIPSNGQKVMLSFQLGNAGVDSITNMEVRMFHLNRDMKIVNVVNTNIENDITSHAAYELVTNETNLNINSGPLYYVLAIVFKDKDTGIHHRKVFYLEWYGLERRNSVNILMLEFPSILELPRLKSALRDELAPYQEDN